MIIIYREICATGHGKDVVYGLNAIYERYIREKMNRLSKNITTYCEGLGMLHSTSNGSPISFARQ